MPPTARSVDSQKLNGDLIFLRVDTAIVGAGPSGVYNAWRLKEAGKDVHLFEYSCRIGGRLFSVPMPGAPHVIVCVKTICYVYIKLFSNLFYYYFVLRES